MLRGALESLVNPFGRPHVLLTTPPPRELHGLGILMVATLLALEGAYCVPLGPQTPLEDIAHAVLSHRIDVVVLSFSIAYPARRVLPILTELRGRLPEGVSIWAGAAGVGRLRAPGKRTGLLSTLDALPAALLDRRAQQQA